MTHICISKITIIGSDYGLSPGLRQANIWRNVGILLIWPLGTKFSEILIIDQSSYIFSQENAYAACGMPFCLSLNELKCPNSTVNSAHSHIVIVWVLGEGSAVIFLVEFTIFLHTQRHTLLLEVSISFFPFTRQLPQLNRIQLVSLWDWSTTPVTLGAVSIRKTVLPGMAIPMLKIRRPNGRLIFNMEITIRR